MELYQIRSFLAIAKHLNFTRAARELRVTQPSLTRAILRLEAELGTPLFRRERAHTHLTELGRLMLPHLEAASAAAEAAKNQAALLKTLESGSFILGISSDVGEDAVMSSVTDAGRRIANLELRLEVAPFDSVERRLLAGEFDAAILASVEDANTRYDLHLIRTEDLVVAFPAGHRFEAEPRLTVAALDGEPLVARVDCRHEQLMARLMEQRGLTRTVRCRCNDPRWVAGFVRDGLGCAVVPTSLARTYDLDFRAIDDIPFRYRTVLATVAGRRHPTALTALICRIRKLHALDRGDRAFEGAQC